ANGFLFLRAGQHAVDEIVDVTPRANLRAVVVEYDRLVLEGLQDDAADRPVAHLSRSIHVEGANDRERQSRLEVMRVREMLGRELAGSVDPPRVAARSARGRRGLLCAFGRR